MCTCDNVLSAIKLVDLGDPVIPVLDCIEHPATYRIAHCRMALLFFVIKFLTSWVTGKQVPVGYCSKVNR